MNTIPVSRSGGWYAPFLIGASVLLGMAAYTALSLVQAPAAKQAQYSPARVNAWAKILPRLQAAEKAGQESASRHREAIVAFFAERKRHTRAFGESVVSLSGKWAFVKSKLPFADGDGHRQFLHEQFEEIVLSGRDLEELIKSVVAGYISELQGIENDMLVQIRADLSDSDLWCFESGAMLRTDESFRKEYGHSLESVAVTVSRDVMVQVGREAVTWVGADIATSITVSLAAGLAERLGISAGILGTVAASGAATLGVGIAAGFVLDALLDSVMKAWGYDPAGDIADKIDATLDLFRDYLLDGDPQAVEADEKLRRLQTQDLFPFVRDECGRAADLMQTSGRLGLGYELKRLKESRSKLCEKALKKLILEGGQS